MVRTAWMDIDQQGRRMQRIVKLCESMIEKELKKKDADHDLILAYMDRLVKSSHHQSQLTDMNLKLNMLVKLAEKKHGDKILEQSLKEIADKREKRNGFDVWGDEAPE